MEKMAKGKGNLLAGMTRKSPPGVDKSMKFPGGSVNDGATRKGVAPQPKPMGPRVA